jgi:CheY-like chemotaxis protein
MPPLQKKKIVVADDDRAVLDSLRLILELEGYEVHAVNSSREIPSTFGVRYPDLFVLDIWMAQQDGRIICRQLKSDPLTANIPIFMISGSNDVADSAFAAGADAFMMKPLSMELLLRNIQTITS